MKYSELNFISLNYSQCTQTSMLYNSTSWFVQSKILVLVSRLLLLVQLSANCKTNPWMTLISRLLFHASNYKHSCVVSSHECLQDGRCLCSNRAFVMFAYSSRGIDINVIIVMWNKGKVERVLSGMMVMFVPSIQRLKHSFLHDFKTKFFVLIAHIFLNGNLLTISEQITILWDRWTLKRSGAKLGKRFDQDFSEMRFIRG